MTPSVSTPRRGTGTTRQAGDQPPWAGAAPVEQQLLLARERARPGLMTLSAVRHHGEVVDFVWDFASAVAARLPCHAGLDLRGRRLLHVLDGRHPETFGHYLRVLLHDTPEATRQAHRVNGRHDIHRHAVTRLGDGVAVTLTNLSALRRLQALRREVRALQAMESLPRVGNAAPIGC